MSKPRRLTGFPIEYFDLWQRAVDSPPVIIELPDSKTAAKLRFSLHAFRRSLLSEPEANAELALLIEGIQVRLTSLPDGQSGGTLIMEPREQDTMKFVRLTLEQKP